MRSEHGKDQSASRIAGIARVGSPACHSARHGNKAGRNDWELAMNCEQIAELIPDYLQGSLSNDQRGLVEGHLHVCEQCREEVALWQKLALLPEEQPGPAL